MTGRLTALSVGLLAHAALAAEPQPTAPPETELGKLAASLKPGEMKPLKTGNYHWDTLKSHYDWQKNLRGAAKGYQVYSWANDGKWDPKTRQILFFGIGHYAYPKFIAYSADANEWTVMELPPWADFRKQKLIVGHSYDRLAISPEHRLFVVNWHGLHLYHIDKKAWSRAKGASSGGKDAYQIIEHFPEMNGFFYEANWGRAKRLWNPETAKSRDLGSHPFGIHGVAEYNPVHKVMLFGGGDGRDQSGQRLYLMNAKGAVKKLQPPHVWMRCTPEAKLACDPVSGEYLVMGRGAEFLYAFHPLKDEWKRLPGVRAPKGMSVAISTYGVVMFCPQVAGFSGKKPHPCYVYKHKPAWPADDEKEAPAAVTPEAE
jgi:hypothetical protein